MLYADGTNRFDVGQGNAGTCWFLSVLSALADKEKLINQVISSIVTDIYYSRCADRIPADRSPGPVICKIRCKHFARGDISPGL